jgi:nucleotide-binding universal stress UspA family protein
MNTPATSLPIVVGIDGSAASDLALDWAATQAAAERRRLVLLAAVSPPPPESSAWLIAHGVDQPLVRAQLKEGARAVFRRSAARVHERYPDLDIQHDLRFADPRDALLDVDADLIVVGTRGLGPIRRLLLGSVASTVVKHATRPTVVVRDRRHTATTDGVLVGVAGDAGDAAAIDLAFRIAGARELPVTAFHAVWDVVGFDEARDVPDDEPRYESERSLISNALERAAGCHPLVEVRCRIGRGFADEGLISASQSADLVVVGHRRKPFLNELIYGSAAPRIVEHAACSVVVAPYHEPGEVDAGPSGAGTTA